MNNRLHTALAAVTDIQLSLRNQSHTHLIVTIVSNISKLDILAETVLSNPIRYLRSNIVCPRLSRVSLVQPVYPEVAIDLRLGIDFLDR